MLIVFVSQFEISGKDNNDEHREIKFHIVEILVISHFEISGKEIKDSQNESIPLILFTLLMSHLEISGKDNNDEHESKKYFTHILTITGIPF